MENITIHFHLKPSMYFWAILDQLQPCKITLFQEVSIFSTWFLILLASILRTVEIHMHDGTREDTLFFIRRSTLVLSCIHQGSNFSDNYLISDFFPTPRAIPEISVNLQRKFLGGLGGFWSLKCILLKIWCFKFRKCCWLGGRCPRTPFIFAPLFLCLHRSMFHTYVSPLTWSLFSP